MTHKSPAELREEMRAVTRGERQSSPIPAAPVPKRGGTPVGGAYPCAHQDPEHTNLLKGSIMHQRDLTSTVGEQGEGICKQPPAQQPG